MIVLDASAAIEVLLDTESGRRIEARVWGDARELPNAPHLLDVEVAQVMGRLVRARRLEADLARAMLFDLRDFDLVRHPHTDLLERALQLRDNVTAYDAVYYYNRPTELGAMQGYGATLMAGAEVMTMLRSFDVEKRLNTFHWRVKKPAAGRP